MGPWSNAEAAEVPSIDAPAPAGVAHGGDAALVIANEDYAFLPDVPYAVRDAEAFAEVLVRTRGVPPERVRILRGANREQILEAFRGLADGVADGTLWLYYSGHGASSPSTTEPVLVGDDAKREASVFAARSVPIPELRGLADGRRLVIVTDACFTGAGRTGEDLVPGARFVVPVWALAEATDQLVVTATGPDQTAGPYEAAEHGLFTWAFAGGLRGWADGASDGLRDGRVTAAELDTWVTRALAVLQAHEQTPVFRGPDDLVLVESAVLEAAPDLRGLPLPGGPRPIPARREVAIARAEGGEWTIDGEPVAYVRLKGLASEDPRGAEALAAIRVMTVERVGAWTTLGTGVMVAGTMLPLSFSSDWADNRGTLQAMSGFGLALVGGGLAWELTIGARTRHRHEDVAAAAARVLAAGE